MRGKEQRLAAARRMGTDETLADRRVFQLDEVQWAAFMAALDLPPRDNPRLRKLLATRAFWDFE